MWYYFTAIRGIASGSAINSGYELDLEELLNVTFLAPQVYHWQNNKVDVASKLKKYRILLWLSIPSVTLMAISQRYFWVPRPLLQRTFVSALIRPWFAFMICGMIITCIFKVEDAYSSFFRWPGWRILNRLAYTVSIINFPIIRYLAGIHTALIPFRPLYCIMITIGVTSVVFMVSVPFHLMVEAPLAQLVKLVSAPAKTKQKST